MKGKSLIPVSLFPPSNVVRTNAIRALKMLGATVTVIAVWVSSSLSN